MIRRMQNALRARWISFVELLLYLPELISFRGHIYVGYSKPYCNRDNYNWGDDINKYLVEKISGKKVIPVQCKLHRPLHYLCIGSILQWFGDKNAIVWGSGLREPLPVRPCKQILAVRGPLTRAELLKQGYDCPEVYGDPVLLMPKLYNPTIEKKYKIGVIPHFSELKSLFVQSIFKCDDFHFIDIKNYGTYEHFIDEILRCEYILSSSLHGCIVSDAYGIPNLWCQFTDYKAEGDGFKFKDYYQSVKKDIDSPKDFRFLKNFDMIVNEINNTWTKNDIDIDLLLYVCPFKKLSE